MTARRTHYGLTFAVLALATFAFSTMQSLIVPVLPLLEHALHTSPTGASWLFTSYLLSAAVATPILGRIGDMFGKEKTLLIVLIALSIGTVLSAVATSLTVMLVGRVIQGAGGSIFPLSFGIIRDEFPPARVATGIGTISSILGFGTGFGIVLAGPIVEHLNYHWLFWIPLFMTLSATVATIVFVPKSPVRATGYVNVISAALMSGWLVTGLLGVSEGPTWGWTNPSTLGLFFAAAILFVFWIRAESRSTSPLIDLNMMRIPTVWSTNLTALLFGFGLFSMFIVLPEFVETPASQGYGFHATVTQSGLYVGPFAIMMLLVAPLTGKLAHRYGAKSLLIVGSLSGAASYAILVPAHNYPWSIYVASGLVGVGTALGYAAMANLIIGAVPPDQTGVASGMNTNLRNIGGALGSAVSTSIVVSHLLPSGFPAESGYVAAFVVCGASFLVAALATTRVPGEERTPVGALSHPALLGETEVFGGTTPYAAEAEA
jgi:EmrB/QacA subfamily drug resistance transporter